jgi:hypothetical protein
MVQRRGGRLRLAAAAAIVCAATLALAGNALAQPRLVVIDPDGRLSGTEPTTLQLSQGPTDRPVSKVTIYAPRGYAAALLPTPGARVGDVYARVKGPQGGVATLKGPITVADPESFRKSPCADDRDRHDAVWLLSFGSIGGTVRVPLFVDRLSGKAAASGSYKLQLCLSTPVGAKQGQQRVTLPLLQTTIAIAHTFRNPDHTGSYAWRAVFTPYLLGKHVAGAAEQAESSSIVVLPAELSLNVRLDRVAGIAVVRGTLEAGGRPIPNTTVAIYAGREPGVDLSDDPALTLETDEAGNFTGALGILGTTYFSAAATVAMRPVPGDLCSKLLPSRSACGRASLAPFFVATPKVVRASF